MLQHVVPVRVYIGVFIALMILLSLTIAAAFLNLGPWSLMLALSIAVAKALLIILFFMHVRYSSHLSWIFAGVGFFWLLILIVLTLSDYISRGLASPAG
jgi:cytochrome c oxidase subunit 4